MKLDEIVAGFANDPEATKIAMFKAAFEAVLAHCDYGHASIVGGDCEFDLSSINFAYFCDDVLGWPNFQDGGIFEQTIENACRAVAGILGYKTKY